MLSSKQPASDTSVATQSEACGRQGPHASFGDVLRRDLIVRPAIPLEDVDRTVPIGLVLTLNDGIPVDLIRFDLWVRDADRLICKLTHG